MPYELSHRYTGVAPAGSVNNAPHPTFKTGVNSRLPLAQRVPAVTPPASHLACTTARSLGGSVILSAAVENAEASALDVALPRRHYGGASPFAPGATVRSSSDVPKRAREPVCAADRDPPAITMASHVTTTHAMSGAYATSLNRDLLSRVRKIEAIDDAARSAQVAANPRADERTNLRTAAITHKRETDPRLAPIEDTYTFGPRARPNAVRANASDSVRFTFLLPPSSYRSEFAHPYDLHEACHAVHDAESHAAPRHNERALVRVAGVSDLLAGSGKSVDHVVSQGYSGHVPAHPRNLSRILGPENEVLRQHGKTALSDVTRSRSSAAAFRRAMTGSLVM